MSNTRYFIYRINLQMNDGKEEIITIATLNKERLPALVDGNKAWFERPATSAGGMDISARKVVGWKFGGELNPFTLSEETYQEELAFCDVIDGDYDPGAAPTPETAERTRLNEGVR